MEPFLNDSLRSILKAEVTAIAYADDEGGLHTAIENPDVANPEFIVKVAMYGEQLPRFLATDGNRYVQVGGRDKRLGIYQEFTLVQPLPNLTTEDQRIIVSAIKRFVKAL